MLKCLLAGQNEGWDGNQPRTNDGQNENKERMEATANAKLRAMKAEIRTNNEEFEVLWGTRVSWMDAWIEGMKACVGKLEANWEMSDAVAKHKLIPNEETRVETIGALKDWYGDWQLAAGCHQQLKKWTQGDGGSRKLAAARKWITRRAIPARHKGRGHKGLMIKRRRKDPECNNGIKNWGTRWQLHRGSERAFNKTVRQALKLEVLKQAVWICVELWKVTDWTLWRGWPPLKRRDVQSTTLRKKKTRMTIVYLDWFAP
jgi:hypothetical protein